MIITNEEKVYGKKANGRFYLSYDRGKNWVEVTEEVYYTVMDNEWKWEKRTQLEVRCRGANFNRCMGDCCKCSHEPSGSVLNFSQFENDEYIPASIDDFSDDQAFEVAFNEFLYKQDEVTRKLIVGVTDERSYSELAKEFGISKSTAHERVVKKLKIFFESSER